ncbi:MAG: FAD-binding oxidoreductase [Pseudomonadales bacterium]
MSELIDALGKVLDQGGLLHGDQLKERQFPGAEPVALARPRTTAEVSAVLRICHERGQGVVPMGGMTGLVEGAQSNNNEVAISLERMNHIEEVDTQSRTMTLEAGVPLQVAQEAAEREQMLFPLDLGARGTATVGGNLSTNAGGNRVIRYGMMRDQVLGLEAVLADGTIITSMNKIIKNNTGYDIKQLFIGAEGTLGIVTRLVLRLRALPASQDMAFVALNNFKDVTTFLNHIDTALGGTLSAFEVMWKDYYKLVTTPPARGKPPLSHQYHYYVLLEALGGHPQRDNERFVQALEYCLTEGIITDAVIAQNQSERDAMWAIRDDVGQVAQNWPIFTFDVSVSLNHMESYVEELKADLTEKWPEHTCMIFGHLGDGNLHIIVGIGDGTPNAKKQVEETVYQGLVSRGGSVSAEHGIGLQKKDYLSWSRSEPEIAMMQLIKNSLDPKNILNPGKIFV